MHWKIARDPLFAPLAREHGEAVVHSAGFFFDTSVASASLDDVDWMCTPMPRLKSEGQKPIVLLSTGAFCPPHPGHLEMLERARAAATDAGYTVIGGYLSPGHDDYVRLKCGDAMISASERLNLCAGFAASTSWLSVDPWEALHRNESVNFTDVTWRLRAYLRTHVDPRVDVFYVCGADNARFAQAFVNDAGCVVVGRPGWEQECATWKERLAPSPRLIWTEGDHPAASRALRSSPLPKAPRPRVVMRLEDERMVQTLGISGVREFQTALGSIFREFADLRTVELGEANRNHPTISLDPYVPGEQNLAVSRLYALGGYQRLAHVARPGAPSLETQFGRIPPGRYVLRDDDSVSGATFDAIRALAPAGVVLERTDVIVQRGEDEDIVDSRDYLLGADDGGLVLSLPRGEVGRTPYILPYVDPFARSSVPPSLVRSFSKAVWSLNARIFDALPLTVAALPQAARAALQVFDGGTRLRDVCRWHLERL